MMYSNQWLDIYNNMLPLYATSPFRNWELFRGEKQIIQMPVLDEFKLDQYKNLPVSTFVPKAQGKRYEWESTVTDGYTLRPKLFHEAKNVLNFYDSFCLEEVYNNTVTETGTLFGLEESDFKLTFSFIPQVGGIDRFILQGYADLDVFQNSIRVTCSRPDKKPIAENVLEKKLASTLSYGLSDADTGSRMERAVREDFGMTISAMETIFPLSSISCKKEELVAKVDIDISSDVQKYKLRSAAFYSQHHANSFSHVQTLPICRDRLSFTGSAHGGDIMGRHLVAFLSERTDDAIERVTDEFGEQSPSWTEFLEPLQSPIKDRYFRLLLSSSVRAASVDSECIDDELLALDDMPRHSDMFVTADSGKHSATADDCASSGWVTQISFRPGLTTSKEVHRNVNLVPAAAPIYGHNPCASTANADRWSAVMERLLAAEDCSREAQTGTRGHSSTHMMPYTPLGGQHGSDTVDSTGLWTERSRVARLREIYLCSAFDSEPASCKQLFHSRLSYSAHHSEGSRRSEQHLAERLDYSLLLGRAGGDVEDDAQKGDNLQTLVSLAAPDRGYYCQLPIRPKPAPLATATESGGVEGPLTELVCASVATCGENRLPHHLLSKADISQSVSLKEAPSYRGDSAPRASVEQRDGSHECSASQPVPPPAQPLLPLLSSADGLMEPYVMLHKEPFRATVQSQPPQKATVKAVVENSAKQAIHGLSISEGAFSGNTRSTESGAAAMHSIVQQAPPDSITLNDCSRQVKITINDALPDNSVLAVSPAPSLPAAVRVLISEECLEEHPLLVRALQSGGGSAAYSYQCIDCPLQAPASILADEATCLCIVDLVPFMEGPAQQQSELKRLMRGLTAVAFKFHTIWVLLLRPPENQCHSQEVRILTMRICQAVCRFPSQVVVRECRAEGESNGASRHTQHRNNELHCLVHGILEQVLFDGGETRQQVVASSQFLQLLDLNDNAPGTFSNADRSVFAAHCEYLQLFPTVNFFVAGLLLSSWTLRELVRNMHSYTKTGGQSHRAFADAVVELLQRRRERDFRNKEALVIAVESFLRLLDIHAGLQLG